jgi:iron complex outermembrane receptor protein
MRFGLILLLTILATSLSAQTIKVRIFDETSREPLPGAMVFSKGVTIGVTDLSGTSKVNKSDIIDSLTIRHIGHSDSTFVVTNAMYEAGVSIFLKVQSSSTGTVVIGSSRYLQALELQTLSIDVIKSTELIQRITPDLAKAAERLPGLTIVDGQASIRGGSGYAFGAGTRVLLIVDNQPLITADRNDIKWNYVPLELAEQIEVVKGASSVQYGSAALNGVIHVRTAYPGKEPETFVSTFGTTYDKPRDASMAWWTGNRIPYQSGLQFRHKERLKNGIDLVVGGNVLRSVGWLNGEYEDRERISFRTRKIWKKGRRSAGIDGNIMHQKQGFFFMWKGTGSDSFLPYSTTTLLNLNDLWANIDPWFTAFDKKANKHTLRGRYYYTLQVGGKDWYPATNLISTDYQFQHSTKSKGTLVAGLSATQFFFDDGGLGGRHDGNFAGTYVQFDQPWKKFQFSAGARMEMFRLDQMVVRSIPVGRAGINYEAGKNTFLRASFGQGFRFPSPAERFVSTNLDVIQIFPNPDIKPEQGWGAEIGVKQKIKIGEWSASGDMALFLTRYRDLLEFSFAYWPGYGVGFKSINVTQAQIGGIELSLNGESYIGKWKVNLGGGYTYICPLDLNKAPELKSIISYSQYAIQSFSSDQHVAGSPILKYRYRHMGKFNIDAQSPEGLTFGAGIRVYSYMEQVDSIFELFVPGLAQFRKDFSGPSAIIDLRGGYLKNGHRFTLQITNITNAFVTIRPAKPEAPRGFMFQYALTINRKDRRKV